MSLKFSNDAEKKFDEIISRYPNREAALLPVLWLAQEQFGYLSRDVQSFVADKLELSLSRVESVVSFYTLYRTKEMGKFHLQLCRNISCSLRGCDDLMKCVEAELGLKPGQTSEDKLFSYSTVECIAACGGAPALQVNDRYVENVTPKALASLIMELRSSGKNNH